MNIWIVRINEFLLMYDNGMQVDPVLNRINVGISCPPVGHDMRTGQNVLFNQQQKGGSTAVRNFSQEALAMSCDQQYISIITCFSVRWLPEKKEPSRTDFCMLHIWHLHLFPSILSP